MNNRLYFLHYIQQTFYNHSNNNIYILFNKTILNLHKNNFGYCLITIGNNYIIYENTPFNGNNNNYNQIKLVPFEENKLNDCEEIFNKYKGKNNEKDDINNKDIKKKKNFISQKSILFIIVFLY